MDKNLAISIGKAFATGKAFALGVRSSGLGMDERWITYFPNGRGNEGRHALIDEEGTILRGYGGLTGTNVKDVRQKFADRKAEQKKSKEAGNSKKEPPQKPVSQSQPSKNLNWAERAVSSKTLSATTPQKSREKAIKRTLDEFWDRYDSVYTKDNKEQLNHRIDDLGQSLAKASSGGGISGQGTNDYIPSDYERQRVLRTVMENLKTKALVDIKEGRPFYEKDVQNFSPATPEMREILVHYDNDNPPLSKERMEKLSHLRQEAVSVADARARLHAALSGRTAEIGDIDYASYNSDQPQSGGDLSLLRKQKQAEAKFITSFHSLMLQEAQEAKNKTPRQVLVSSIPNVQYSSMNKEGLVEVTKRDVDNLRKSLIANYLGDNPSSDGVKAVDKFLDDTLNRAVKKKGTASYSGHYFDYLTSGIESELEPLKKSRKPS